MRTFLGKHQTVLIALGLAILTLGVFWRVTGHEFLNYDDGVYAAENPYVLGGLTSQGLVWAFKTFCAGNWHPLTWVSLMLDAAVFGREPFGFHLMNLIFHLANVLLLFLLLNRMTHRPWRSAFVAALFAIHPLHVESVAWLPERKDVLSTFFGLLAILAYVGYVRRPSWGRYVPILLLFALSLMAKPMLVTLPILLLLLDYWPLRRSDQSSVISNQSGKAGPSTKHQAPWIFVLEKGPLFVLSAGSCVVAYIAQHASGAMANLDRIPVGLRIGNALESYVNYALKTVYPAKLAVFYPYPRSLDLFGVFGAAGLLIATTVLVMCAARTRPYLAFGWVWYVVSLLPVIGLVQVGAQAMADRYTYVPLIGLFIMIAWGIPELMVKWSNGQTVESSSPINHQPSTINHCLPLIVVALAVVAAFSVRSYRQVSFWQDNRALFGHAIEVTKDNYLAHHNLGVALFQDGDLEGAKEHFAKAVRIRPEHTPAQCALGTVLMQTGRPKEAMRHLSEAVRLDNNLSDAHNSLGLLLAAQGRPKEAIAHYEQALRIEPQNPDTHFNMAAALAASRELPQAAEQYAEALRLRPNDAEAHNGLGIVLMCMGRRDQAVTEFKAALEIDPNCAGAQDNLVKALNTKE